MEFTLISLFLLFMVSVGNSSYLKFIAALSHHGTMEPPGDRLQIPRCLPGLRHGESRPRHTGTGRGPTGPGEGEDWKGKMLGESGRAWD